MEVIRQEILDTMLKPYYPKCRYLKKAEIDFPTMYSKLSIPETFYGAASGHFNATEMMMCLNQMCYVFFAKSFEDGLVKSAGKISLDEFVRHQMGDCYVAKLNNIKFRAEINPDDFVGEMSLKKSPRRGNTVFVTTDFSFYYSKGTLLLL